MKNLKELKAVFNRYAGVGILNPDRITCDMDQTLGALGSEVRELGFDFEIYRKGTAETRILRPDNLVRAEYTETDGEFKLTGAYHLGNG